MASSNTSKTAHVMNLLSKNRSSAAEAPVEPKEAEPAAPQAPQAAPEAPQPARTTPVAPIISSITADAAVSSQIKDALEAELEDAPAPAAPPAPQPAAEVPVQPEAPAEPKVQVPQEAPMDLPAAPERPKEESSAYINVMQILVEEKADEYMKMFGICCCDKCRVDVRAYALNHLPPKYVVLSENERVPRLTVYENRFSSDITAQLIQACKQVMLTPHHSRPEN